MNRPAISRIGTTLLLCLISGAVAQAQSKKVFTANGPFAFASPCSVSGTTLTCLFLRVFRGGTTPPSTFLFYDIFTADLSTGFPLGDLIGSGTIPNSAFQVQGKTDSLFVDTSALDPSLFANMTCTFDPSTGMEPCVGSHGGVVSGKWTGFFPFFGGSTSGTSKFGSPGFAFITTGNSDFNFALANVTVLGQTFTDPIATIGKEHNTSISIERK